MNDQATQLRELVERQARGQSAPASGGSLGRPPRAGPPTCAPSLSSRWIAVVGARGGVGATTVALELGTALGRLGREVLLVDAAPAGDIALRCRLPEGDNLADVLAGRRTIPEARQRCRERLHVLPSVWGTARTEWPSAAMEDLAEQLRNQADRATTVLVDAGDGSSPLARRLVAAAEQVVVVTSSDVAALMAAYATIKLVRCTDGAAPRWSLLVRACDAAAADEVALRLAQACRRFLGLALDHARWWPDAVSPGAARKQASALEALLR